MDTPHRTLLFLDVDGPLIPFGAAPADHQKPSTADKSPHSTNPLLTRVDPTLGPLLSDLPCEMVWATTWLHEANHVVCPLLGLPALAVVEWPDRTDHHVDEWFGLHWKTRTLVEWSAGRPFIWVDDEISDNDQQWVSRHHPEPALLFRVDPRIGLQHSDFATLTEWLATAAPSR
ncbi:HAD domain-containing protein [Nocardia sp. NBC_01327]|uniref:HAD domain-containing protein n=1 Tax=Nocardia sp. NBC_01327 TaxID=2903593 RepID=UPI002E129EEF|nr:HAD domain-containing protein [Nocardia sp. NBC_01327]